MKAITILQPWATLIVAGIKQFETRSWSTRYRGQIAIHAGKNPRYINDLIKTFKHVRPTDLNQLTNWERAIYESLMEKSTRLAKHFADKSLDFWFPTGVILGEATLSAMHAERPPHLTQREQILGGYGAGRWAWQMNNPTLYPQFIPVSGKQGLWNWTR